MNFIQIKNSNESTFFRNATVVSDLLTNFIQNDFVNANHLKTTHIKKKTDSPTIQIPYNMHKNRIDSIYGHFSMCNICRMNETASRLFIPLHTHTPGAFVPPRIGIHHQDRCPQSTVHVHDANFAKTITEDFCPKNVTRVIFADVSVISTWQNKLAYSRCQIVETSLQKTSVRK